MKIESVKAYNVRKRKEYEKACQDWSPEIGGFPNIGNFCWFTSRGEYRKAGFILSYNHTAILTKTKRKAVEEYNNYERGIENEQGDF